MMLGSSLDEIGIDQKMETLLVNFMRLTICLHLASAFIRDISTVDITKLS